MNTIKQNIGNKKIYMLYAISILLIGIVLFYTIISQIAISNTTRILFTVAFSFVFSIIIFYSLFTFLSPTPSYWTIDSTFLSVGYSNFKERLLATKKKHPIFSIRLKSIHYAKIDWGLSTHKDAKTKFHHIMLTIETYDGSITTFKALETTDKETFCRHIKYLADIGVTIIDTHNVLKMMEEKEMDVDNCIEEIEVKNHD